MTQHQILAVDLSKEAGPADTWSEAGQSASETSGRKRPVRRIGQGDLQLLPRFSCSNRHSRSGRDESGAAPGGPWPTAHRASAPPPSPRHCPRTVNVYIYIYIYYVLHNIYIYIYIRTHVYYICIYTYIHTYTCTHISLSLYIYIYIYIHIDR